MNPHRNTKSTRQSCSFHPLAKSLILYFALLANVHADEVTIVEKQRATHFIYHAADAPEAPRLAARDLQQTIRRSTGVTLEITTDAAVTPAIRIVSDASLPHDGFEIACRGKDIVIRGNDVTSSAKPDAGFVPSRGTLNGTDEFLERFVGARWLFPGELGEDVPRHDSIRVVLPEPLRGAPSFANRLLAYVGESEPDTPGRPKAATLSWMRRQRLTNGFSPSVTGYGHSWDDYLQPADMEAHPEWKSSNGEAVRKGKVQFFCMTAPGLVETFAKRVIEIMDRYPTRGMASISPTDGGGFCTCERCAKLVGKDPYGKVSHSVAVLTFYKAVAEIIQRERPGKSLGGLVYYNYQYPPAQVPTLPENLSLCWAPLNYYGYGLLKPKFRAEFGDVLTRWCEVAPHFFYHNYSTWMRSYHGAPLPVSLDILKLELPTAAKHHAWGAHMVGTTAWGVNAPVNYLLAKQMWNAKVDVSATLDEWLQRAYGPGWKSMRQLYDELDDKMRVHKEAQPPVYKGSQYEVNEDVMQNVYAPLFPDMERHYRETLARCETDVQRQRLAMFGDNLTQLHYALRKAALIIDDAQSLFHRDDAAFAKFLSEMESKFSLYRDGQGLDHGPIWKGEYQGP